MATMLVGWLGYNVHGMQQHTWSWSGLVQQCRLHLHTDSPVI